MSHFGLALSGGGFRATLYHLGVVRFLRDANILPRVSHITSVSGGSIMAAHLVLDWQRYTGSDEDYDEAAAELLDFIRLDVRNRVVRRFPLAYVANGLRWLLLQGRSRRLTRPGLLEAHYEKFLYGDKCLYELPAVPQLHMLATNINEGCLCSFTRSGLLVQHRLAGGGTRFESVPSALTTVPMAVTASSAFPGFFPPLQLTADDVGAEENRFPRTCSPMEESTTISAFACFAIFGSPGSAMTSLFSLTISSIWRTPSKSCQSQLIQTPTRL